VALASACLGDSDSECHGIVASCPPIDMASTASTGTSMMPELPNSCDVLTAAEASAALGITVTAKSDALLPTACVYEDDKGAGVGTLTVEQSATVLKRLDGLVANPPPGATFELVPGIGDKAALAGPPEGRALVVQGDFGFDYTRSSGASPASVEQLTAILQAIVTP
jgi:hypothetical protein